MLKTSGVTIPFHCHDADAIGKDVFGTLLRMYCFWIGFKGDEMLELTRTWSKSMKNTTNTMGKTS